MASISSVGFGSGLFSSDLIDQLVEVEREPTVKRLDLREAEINTQLSDFGRIQSALINLRLSARVLSNPDALGTLKATSTASNFSATVDDSSAITGTYSVEVTALAQAHSIATGVFVDKETTLGTGTLNITAGGTSAAITIDNGNNTLEGVRDAINAESSLNVSASVIDTGSGYQLVLAATETGLDNAIEVTVTDDDGNNTDTSGLSQLAFNGSAQNLTETVAALDSSVKINGITLTRSSNVIDDAITGVTLNLSGKNAGSPATLKLELDSDGITDRVQDFVDKYNELQTLVNEVTAFDTSTNQAGSLLGDASLRNIMSQTRNLLGSVVGGLESAGVRTLSEVGITTKASTGESSTDGGTLIFDATTFKQKLASSRDDIMAIFAEQGRTSDSQVKFLASTDLTKAGSYSINVTQLATRGALTGSLGLVAPVTIDDNNNTFKIKVNGVESADITLTNGSYTLDQLTTEIATQINADSNLKGANATVNVSVDGSNQLQITSTTYGSSSSVEITQIDTNTTATLGLSVVAGTAGVDVAGTINGKTATGVGQTLKAATGDDSTGIQVQITGGATGDRGTVTFIEGVAEQLVSLVTNFVSVDGALTTKTDGLNTTLQQISNERVKLDERLESFRERITKQFIAADILVTKLQSTQDYIKQQLDALNGVNKNN
ncbi:flagellar filament capping protein FliD [Zooshikella marina]|uniref:flagellar filament capping protein FliD n=1 Tax=Zooshikella ganghwensis TaxID=202772 RepID=UPI001BAF25F6|nr:flagellar filament capping protein FliD [Zooshikella ganghwensis]MBU2706816.1 flagellar filament capping protein FliD [Zooshikella ganghwensis]